MAHPDSDDVVIQPKRNNPALSTCLEQLRLQSGSFSLPANEAVARILSSPIVRTCCVV